jgi:hypothetical protein
MGNLRSPNPVLYFKCREIVSMNIRKKALKLYIYVVILGIVAAGALSVFAALETGIVRGIVVVVAIIMFVCSIAQFILYRYFYRGKV